MSEEPSQKSFLSFFSNLFSKEKNNSSKTIETPDDEQIEELIQNVLKIKDAIVREIMIPKVNISYINEDSDMQKVYKTIQDTRHSRYPVFDKSSEKAVGILHVKDLIDEGKTEEEIYSFMSDKYGEWIVFKPELNMHNSLLWILPYIALIFGGFFIFSFLKKRQ